jgi:plastocyanin
MPRIRVFPGLLGAALLFGCGDNGSDISQPDNRPENSVSIVPRAETMGTSAFDPNPITIPLNGVVHWYNDDRAAAGGQYGGSNGTIHTVTADDVSAFLSGNLTPGRTFEHAFATAGSYNYHCSIHPTMKGTVIVTP